MYCIPWEGGHGKRVPRTVGHYRIKIIGDVTLILECQKCLKKMKVRMMGSMLGWQDFADVEKIESKRDIEWE